MGIFGDWELDSNKIVVDSYASPAPMRPHEIVDVCFINGCSSEVPHPPRYRVSHQREQLEFHGISTSEIFYTDVIAVDDVRYASMFIIFRCPYTDEIGKLISLAKKLNKPVYFDVDDLVIDTEYTEQLPYIQKLKGEEKELYNYGVRKMGETLLLCDGAITTTGALANELLKYVPKVLINRNVSSQEMVELSEDALKNKDTEEREEKEFRIGYFSGSITHNSDVEMILPALENILEKYSFVKLYIVGELSLPEELEPYRSQIVAIPFLAWKELPALIASVDVNLAPIEDTVFNRAKSENKWVEASFVKTLTIASDVGGTARS